jgi:hypothetical protein
LHNRISRIIASHLENKKNITLKAGKAQVKVCLLLTSILQSWVEDEQKQSANKNNDNSNTKHE